jgi:PRC-barrel domain
MIRMLLTTATVIALIGSGVYAQSEKPTGAVADAISSASNPKFVAAQRADQWVFSRFKGTSVVGPDNANVGAVSDLLFDRTGKIAGVIVGVGGFLGIGAKNVAIDMSGFDVVPIASSAGPSAVNSDDANAVKLKVAWTKEQLMDAPNFRYYASTPPATTGAAPAGNKRPLSQ